jgi:adenine-specific DNA-methyltransferase
MKKIFLSKKAATANPRLVAATAKAAKRPLVPALARQHPETSAIQLDYSGRIDAREVLGQHELIRGRLRKQYGEVTNGWANRLIHSNNLDAMRTLLADPAVARKVTLAYIDPPFATGNEFHVGGTRTATISRSSADQLAYADRFEPTAYLEFIRQRLILLKELLSPQGSIWVHIGHQMSHYVRVLLDEVFGPTNFLNEIARVKCNPKNFGRRAFGNIKDTLLYYSNTGNHVWNEQRETVSEEDLARLFPRVDSQGRRYTTTPLHAPGETRSGPTGQNWNGLTPPQGRHWRYDPQELTRLDRAGLIQRSPSGNPRKIVFAEQVRHGGKKRQDIWTFKDPAYPTYPTQKNAELLRNIVLTSTNPGDLVLDCFVGSGTTLAAAASQGRRWIGIDSSAIAIRRTTTRMLALPSALPFRVEEIGLS